MVCKSKLSGLLRNCLPPPCFRQLHFTVIKNNRNSILYVFSAFTISSSLNFFGQIFYLESYLWYIFWQLTSSGNEFFQFFASLKILLFLFLKLRVISVVFFFSFSTLKMSLHCVPACIVPEMLAVFFNFSLLNYVTPFTLVAFKIFCDLPEFECYASL